MGCAARGCTRAWGAGGCLLTTALAMSRSRWIAARSPWLTTGGSRGNFQSKQISRTEMPGPFFQLILLIIWLRKRGTEKLKVNSWKLIRNAQMIRDLINPQSAI